MKLFILIFLALTSAVNAIQITQDERYVYTKRTWPELADTEQKDLMYYFNQQLNAELASKNIPTKWDQETEQMLLGSMDQYNSIIQQTQNAANTYASENNIQLKDLIPNGFIVGLGVGGSGDFGIGVGGSALMTLIIVPLAVERFDKLTGETDNYYEASWNIGGFGQGGLNVGVGAGVFIRGALGIIWGDLPDATQLNGVALGMTVNVAAVQGLGFKAAILFNNDTKEHNLIAMATYDVGVIATAEIEGSVFYFMSAKEILDYMSLNSVPITYGNVVIDAQNIQH